MKMVQELKGCAFTGQKKIYKGSGFFFPQKKFFFKKNLKKCWEFFFSSVKFD
jgi:hypothetical protein